MTDSSKTKHVIQIIADITGGCQERSNTMVSLVDAAGQAGADGIKVAFYAPGEAHPGYPQAEGLVSSPTDWRAAVVQARSLGLQVWADVFGPASLALATGADVDGLRIQSADFNNYPLLDQALAHKKPLMLGTGGHKRVEIYEAVAWLRGKDAGVPLIMTPDYSVAPTPLAEHSLAELRWLCMAYHDLKVAVCCADALDGASQEALLLPVAAVGAGITFIEKRLTTDQPGGGPALDAARFAEMCAMVRRVELTGAYPNWSPGQERCWEQTAKRVTGKNLTRLDVRPNIGMLLSVRLASKRLPRKGVLPICGRESIALLIERLKYSAYGGQIVLCTTENPEDDALEALAAREQVGLFRGPNEEVALRLLLAAEKFNLDHFVRITGDDLLRDIELLDAAVQLHLQSKADYTNMPDLVYSTESEVISRRALRVVVERAVVPTNTEYLTWYLDDPSAFVCAHLPVPDELRRDYRLTLDTEADLQLFKAIFEALYRPGQLLTLREVIAWLDRNPAIARLNQSIRPKLKREELDVRMWI